MASEEDRWSGSRTPNKRTMEVMERLESLGCDP